MWICFDPCLVLNSAPVLMCVSFGFDFEPFLPFSTDYGFLDTSSNGVAYDMVAQQLLGKRRIVEGIGSGRFMSESDRARTLDRLGETSLENDERLLEETSDPSLAAAYSYRIGVKKALSRLGRSD